MALSRADGGTTLIDVLDRILDKGIVVDAWIHVSLVGIDFLTVEARVVIASFETYLSYEDKLATRRSLAAPVLSISGKHKRGRSFALAAGGVS
jgi:hypothetical protein